MIRILVLEPTHLSNTGYWRLYRPLDVMRQLYPGVFHLTYKYDRMTYADIMECDIVITRRPGSVGGGEAVVKLLEKARMLGRHVIFDEDDAVFSCPDTHELFSVFQRKDVREQYAAALRTASMFWFSTPAFLETIHPEGLVIPNAILPTDMPDAPTPDLGLFGWQGKSIQVHDLMAGRTWYDANKDKAVAWLFFGYKPPLDHSANTKTIPYIEDVDIYMASFRQNGINAMWKPLTECAFNDHKSNINWLGATMGGGYCITNYAGRPGWEFASAEVLPYSDACDLWAASKAQILENYNLLHTARMRAESIFALVPNFLPQAI
jgi:hypothetical protein